MEIQFPSIPATFGNSLQSSQVKRPTDGAVPAPATQAKSPTGTPYSADELQTMVNQMQAQVGSFFNSLGQGDTSGIGSLTSSMGALPDITDPTGDAIDYLLNSTGNGSRAGDIFNLALSANNQGLELAQVQGNLAARAEAAYQQSAALVQMVEDAKSGNMATLLQLGGGSASAGINDLI